MTRARRPQTAGGPAVEAALRAPLLEMMLRLGDDRLVLGHRLSEWCGHAPILEEDLAIANLALDLTGQASLLLERAAELEGAGRSADDLAFLRDVGEYRNCLLVEQRNGDFAVTIVRQFLFDAFDRPFTEAISSSKEASLAAFGERAAKEAAYHLRHSGEWVIRLGDGTAESRRRMLVALDELWPFAGELFERDPVTEALAEAGIVPDPAAIHDTWQATVSATLREAGLPAPAADGPVRLGGRRGLHSEALGRMLDEMQIVARSHPGATW